MCCWQFPLMPWRNEYKKIGERVAVRTLPSFAGLPKVLLQLRLRDLDGDLWGGKRQTTFAVKGISSRCSGNWRRWFNWLRL